MKYLPYTPSALSDSNQQSSAITLFPIEVRPRLKLISAAERESPAKVDIPRSEGGVFKYWWRHLAVSLNSESNCIGVACFVYLRLQF